MTQITLKGTPIHTVGSLPPLHAKVPDFTLVDGDLRPRALQDFAGKKKLLATVPSLDTGVCSLMTKHLNQFATNHPDWTILVVSADLPFAQKRFCQTEKVQHVHTLSMMRDKEFGRAYGVLMQDGPLAGLLARALFIVSESDELLYVELVSEVTHEPQYDKAFQYSG